MAYLGFGVESQGSLRDSLDEIPDDAKIFLRFGFSQVATLGAEKWASLVEAVQSSSGPNDLDIEATSAALAIDSSATAAALSAAKLALGVISYRQETAKEFVEIGRSAKIINEENFESILSFLTSANDLASRIRNQLDATSLRNENLPSLRQFELSVDVRVRFSKDGVDMAAPVVVAHVDTDAQDMEVWFQMTPSQLSALITRLQKLEANIALANKFIDNALAH